MAHHLYVCPVRGTEYRQHLAFRNYLSLNPAARDEYAELKKAIIREIGNENRALYVELKQERSTSFVKRILEQAGFQQ